MVDVELIVCKNTSYPRQSLVRRKRDESALTAHVRIDDDVWVARLGGG